MQTIAVHYKDGYEFQTTEPVTIQTELRPKRDIVTRWVCLTRSGLLTVIAGYAWDGGSGFLTIQTDAMIAASLFHDACYGLMRQGYLSPNFKEQIDDMFHWLCLEFNMYPWRAWYVHEAVERFADHAADPANAKPILIITT